VSIVFSFLIVSFISCADIAYCEAYNALKTLEESSVNRKTVSTSVSLSLSTNHCALNNDISLSISLRAVCDATIATEGVLHDFKRWP